MAPTFCLAIEPPPFFNLMDQLPAVLPSLPKKVKGILKKKEDITVPGSQSSPNTPRVGFYMDGAPSHTFLIPHSPLVYHTNSTRRGPHERNVYGLEGRSEREELESGEALEYDAGVVSRRVSKEGYRGAHAAVILCLVAVCTYQVVCGGGL